VEGPTVRVVPADRSQASGKDSLGLPRPLKDSDTAEGRERDSSS
jgi:hypothetical protein